MRSNDTLGNTPFQLISDLFRIHVNKVLSVLNMLPGVCWGGGGGATGLLNKGGGLPGLATKQHAVEFPQVQTSIAYCGNP